ncbi:hypothetical protein EVU94_08805 [Flavobacteriaceae bacterium 144Ye]|nr:hypothetical protein EVU94_08805 [Flavobacteriaceae bacterium 144Ye]
MRLILIFFICFSINSFSQEFNKPLIDTNLKLSKNDVQIPDDLILKVYQDENGFTHVVVNNGVEDIEEILLKPFSFDLFKTKMKVNILNNLVQKSAVSASFIDEGMNEALINLYSEINSYFNTVNERPEVAKVKLKSERINVYANLEHEKEGKPKKIRLLIGKLINPEIVMTFYSGFIEKIEVHGELNGNEIKLSNKYSIGVSSESNVKSFNEIRLFTKYPYNIKPEKIGDAIKPTNPRNQSYIDIDEGEYRITIQPEQREVDKDDYEIVEKSNDAYIYLYLNDLISYDRYIDVNANDISPTKQRIVLDGQQKSTKVYKEESTKIIEAVIYSDLLAAVNEENPSGVIQTEVAKKFNINTARNDFLGGGAGMFEYLDARILYSKIEADNKFNLPTDGTFKMLDLFNHRNFTVGGLLNILSIEEQDLKLNIFYDSGVEFSRSGYKLDANDDEEHLNALQWSHQLKFHLFPEKRYGIVFRDKLFYYEILENNSDFLELLNKKKDWFNVIELSAYLDIATSAKVFVKYALVHELSDLDNNFSRFQLGTAFYFLQKNRKDIKPNN